MRIWNREKESRKLIGEKLRQARMADDSPMTEEDAEYYRILAEARANHSARTSRSTAAKKRRLARAAMICVMLAVAGGSYILGMQSDSSASADPDNERKVVQQGDNIVIGTGVSEDGENVGVVTKTYYSLDDVPGTFVEGLYMLDTKSELFDKVKINIDSENQILGATIYYITETSIKIIINEDFVLAQDNNTKVALKEVDEKWDYKGITVYKSIFDSEEGYSFSNDDCEVRMCINEQLKRNEIEAFVDDLLDLE